MRVISFKADGKTIEVPPNAKTNGKEILYSGEYKVANKKDLEENPNDYMVLCMAEKGTKKEELIH